MPDERAVRLAINAARYRTALAAALAQLAVTAHRQAAQLRQALGQPDDDPDEPAEIDADHYPDLLNDARNGR